MFSPSPSGNVGEVVESQRQEKNRQNPPEGARRYPDLWGKGVRSAGIWKYFVTRAKGYMQNKFQDCICPFHSCYHSGYHCYLWSLASTKSCSLPLLLPTSGTVLKEILIVSPPWLWTFCYRISACSLLLNSKLTLRFFFLCLFFSFCMQQ